MEYLHVLIKQREEGQTGHPIIKQILFNRNFYGITLMIDLVVQNIANFCCTKNTKNKISLNFDFIFELLKEPPFYALASTYKNTSLYMLLCFMLKIPRVVQHCWALFFCVIKETRK